MRMAAFRRAVVLALAGTSALRQSPEAGVVVPDAPCGALCYRADRMLFGPYGLTFCLERRGTCAVRGGGLECDGRLSWRAAEIMVLSIL